MKPSPFEVYDRIRPLASKPFRAVCYAPFTSLFFDTIGLVRVCCVNRRFVLGSIANSRLDEIWFGEKTREIREAMIHYDLSLGCEFCEWQINDGNIPQGQNHYTSVHALKYDRFHVGADGDYWPSNMEFNLSNTCNLECVMCTGEFSSSIRSRREKLPALPRVYDDQFFNDLRKYIPHVRTSQFLGGEPFLINEHFKVWELMVELGNSEQVGILTNGTIYNKRVQWVLDNLPVGMTMSMDGITKETFEKIRVNAVYEEFIENFHRFNEYMKKQHGWMGINFTLSRLNWFELPDMLLFAEKNGCQVNVCTLVFPDEMSIYKLPPDELAKVIEQYEARDHELSESLERNLGIWRSAVDNLRHRVDHADRDVEVTQIQHETGKREAAAKPRPAPPKPEAAPKIDRDLESWLDELQKWSGSPAVKIRCDESDVISEVAPANGSLGLDMGLVGRPLTAVQAAMNARWGEILGSEAINEREDLDDRVVVWRGSDSERNHVRVVRITERNADGAQTGTVILLAQQMQPASAGS